MDQQIRFCQARDGVRIAYATIGGGPPLVKTANWMSHLEFDWQSPVWRHLLDELASDRLLVRYDERASGLSDWDVEDISLDAWVSDLEAVVDALGLERFPLLGISQGGAVSVAYAARHPDRVSHLVLYGAYARGWARLGAAEGAERAAQLALTRIGWGKDNPAYRQVFTALMMPQATPEQQQWFTDLMRVSASPENAVRIQEAFGQIDISELAPRLAVPTLVLHCREDARITFEQGRRLAALIPDARFVPLEGKNHILLPTDPGWDMFFAEVRAFLGAPRPVPSTRVRPSPARDARPVSARPRPMPSTPEVARDAHALIAGLHDVRLSRFAVTGAYARYDETVRHALKDIRQKIAAGLDGTARRRENHLLWAPPGSGKTFFVQQVAASLGDGVGYHEVNLAGCGEAEFREGLRAAEAPGPRLCFVDEVDAKPHEAWPYELLLPHLDLAVERGARLAVVLAGSSASDLAEMKRRIAARPKGEDLLNRVPGGNEYTIPSLGLGDRLLVTLAQLRRSGGEAGRDVRAVEKLALYYIALTPHLTNARQLRELAVRAVERMPRGEDRVKYDHLFNPGDPENKAFWIQAQPAAGDLVNRFTSIED